MQGKRLALVGATLVSMIYGVTFTVAKDVMPVAIKPSGFILIRVGATCLLFWITQFALLRLKKIPAEKIARKDYVVVLAAAFFGVALNMLTFFKGLSYTTPISAAVLMVTTPLIVMLLSAVFLKERISFGKSLGIILGLSGAVLLIACGKSAGVGSNETLGNFLVFVNALSYGFYLIIVRQLMNSYNVFSFVGWVYFLGFLMVLPFGYSEFNSIQFDTFTVDIWLKVSFIIVASTYVTYLLNLVTMRRLSPVVIAVFIYLQPVFATIFAISLGKDILNASKLVSAILIGIGVALTVKRKA